jgi:hypothetical protein
MLIMFDFYKFIIGLNYDFVKFGDKFTFFVDAVTDGNPRKILELPVTYLITMNGFVEAETKLSTIEGRVSFPLPAEGPISKNRITYNLQHIISDEKPLNSQMIFNYIYEGNPVGTRVINFTQQSDGSYNIYPNPMIIPISID